MQDGANFLFLYYFSFVTLLFVNFVNAAGL